MSDSLSVIRHLHVSVSGQQEQNKMIELNKIESQFFNLMNEKISINDFEKWVYKSEWLENELEEDEYLDLISLNYGTSSAKYEVGKILKNRISKGNFETVKMIELLNSIIERDGKEGKSLSIMYDLYCKGYYFLEDLGLGIGIFIEVSPAYKVEYSNLSIKEQKNKLIDSVYPSARLLATELKNWLINGELKLTGEQEPELNRWQYIDNRSDEDKISRVWKVETIDKETGEIRSKRNILINDNGDF